MLHDIYIVNMSIVCIIFESLVKKVEGECKFVKTYIDDVVKS